MYEWIINIVSIFVFWLSESCRSRLSTVEIGSIRFFVCRYTCYVRIDYQNSIDLVLTRSESCRSRLSTVEAVPLPVEVDYRLPKWCHFPSNSTIDCRNRITWIFVDRYMHGMGISGRLDGGVSGQYYRLVGRKAALFIPYYTPGMSAIPHSRQAISTILYRDTAVLRPRLVGGSLLYVSTAEIIHIDSVFRLSGVLSNSILVLISPPLGCSIVLKW